MNIAAIPALIMIVVTGLSLSLAAQPTARAETSEVSVSTATKVQTLGNEPIIKRKMRIERLLVSLDRVASVAIQMRPENAERLEPVIVDLAEQTLELVTHEAIQNNETDIELDRLEVTVGRLVKTMNRMIEPEMSL